MIKIKKLLVKTGKIKTIYIGSIRMDEEYRNLYQQEGDKVKRIAADMKANGFDRSQPIILLPDNTIIDGHSRYLAARRAEIKYVPVIYKDISKRTDVLTYMEHLQLDRRNLTDAEKIQHYENLMQLKQQAKSEGKSIENYSDENVAKQLNISPRQIQKIREVEKKASPEQLDALKNGSTTINQVHTEIKATQKNPSRTKKNDPEIHFEIPENMDAAFIDIAKKTNEFVKQLALYAKSLGKEQQMQLLGKYSVSEISAKKAVGIWNSIMDIVEHF